MTITSNANFTFRRNTNLIAANSATGKFYTFAAKSTAWPDDNNPPEIDNSVQTNEYTILNEMLFGKNVPDTNLSLMAKRYDWTSDTVYTAYDDTDPLLFTKNFFVLTTEAGSYHVFKCLNNNSGAKSTSQPLLSETSADDQYYSTADGYQWKYMYSFDSSSYSKFATSDYIPVSSNSAVVGNAAPGALEAFIIESAGSNYNSYTNGYFTDISVGGNTLFFGVQGSDTTILTISANAFTVGEKVTQAYSGVLANGYIESQYTASGNTTHSILTLKNVSGVFSAGSNTITGVTSSKTATVYDESSPDISSNSNFYDGCTLYISSGTGAGQINHVSQYIVVGNARRILMTNTFTTIPDLTSKYIISPRVIIDGDGSGAEAISTIDPTTKKLKNIQIINRGSGYNYANVSVIGNTGSLAVAANVATVRAILSPRGGHGSNTYSELNAIHYGFSTTFANSESGKISGTGTEYRRVGIITDPIFANVAINYNYTSVPTIPTSNSSTTVTLYGSTSGAQGIITTVSTGTNTVYISNVSGLFQSSEVLTAKYSNGAIALSSSPNTTVNTITGQGSVFDNRTLLICPTSTLTGGSFAVNEKIVQVDGTVDIAYATINEIITSGSNSHIYLTEVKGVFQSSNLGTSTYKYIYDDATRQVSIEVDEVIKSDLVPYTGKVLYVQNIEPVIRNTSQSETVKLIIGFT